MDRSPVPVTGAPVIQAFGGLNGYWGQLGSEPLKAYCDSHPEYITLSFVNQAPEQNPSNLPGTNFAGHCAGGTYGNSNLLSECYTIQEGIPYCKDRGVKILLSIGGVYSDEGSNYKVTTDDKGRDFADFLYKSFGPHNEHSNPIRPFDSIDNDGNTVHAAVDGFDFDIEHDLPNGPYIAMINRLRELDEGLTITGAPQCPTSDEYFYMKDMIKSAKFDALFVQFYNNPWCDAVSQGHEGESFNYDKWVEIIEESDCSKDAKLYVGLPASEEAAPGGGYLEPEDLKDLVCELTTKPHFGGVSLWDLTRGAGNIIEGKSYNEHVMDALNSTIDAPVESDTATGTAATTNVSGATEPTTIATAYSTYRGWNTTSTGAAAYTQAYGNPTTLAHSGSLTTEGSPAYTNYPGNTGAVSMTTSTVCTTRVHTVTQCPPEVVDCLFGSVTTETIPLYTTVCPVTDKAKHTGYATQYAPPPQYETRTVYTTSVHAINKCAPGVVDCPYGSVTTETIPVYTTICPVTETYNQAPTDVPVNHEIKTLYTSQAHTVAQCQPENPNCQVGAVTTEIASWTTAIVPAHETQLMKAYKPAAELPKPLTVESHLNGTVYTSVVVPPATLKTATKPGVFEQARPTYKQTAQEQHSGAAAPTGGRNDKGPIETYAPAPITPATAGASSMVVGLTALAGIALLQVVALW
ncbi:unnamed protein product [Fusarium graminearum]|nr:hypothetical protein FGRA07_04615 [Fusarium graminearum]CAF3463408.1 unnamed protein product [Fusarium graminearum]